MTVCVSYCSIKETKKDEIFVFFPEIEMWTLGSVIHHLP